MIQFIKKLLAKIFTKDTDIEGSTNIMRDMRDVKMDNYDGIPSINNVEDTKEEEPRIEYGTQFNAYGNITHSCNDFREIWNTYDENQNIIYHKNDNRDNVYEYWKKYDDAGRVLHFADSRGYEEHYTYDKKGNKTIFSDSEGNEEHYTYNEDNMLVYEIKKVKDDDMGLHTVEKWYGWNEANELLFSHERNRGMDYFYDRLGVAITDESTINAISDYEKYNNVFKQE